MDWANARTDSAHVAHSLGQQCTEPDIEKILRTHLWKPLRGLRLLAASRVMPSYGQKDFSELGSYDPTAVEPFWNAYWEQNGCYEADSEDGKEPFVMCLPPPNVTGHLHIGHGFMAAIEDAIARTHRMQGRSVLWIPGTDHAGIATQSVVERRLQR
ncbi:MAG: hypothetical protein MHM6MM_008970, partial [Cercozoa sp. M6MM]